jgi:hypothetical protein
MLAFLQRNWWKILLGLALLGVVGVVIFVWHPWTGMTTTTTAASTPMPTYTPYPVQPTPTQYPVQPTLTPYPTVPVPPSVLPTATPGAMAPTPSTSLPSGGADRPSNCPTDAEMQQTLGFKARGVKPVFTGEGIEWDNCKWNWQAYGVGTLEFDLPTDWQATVTRSDDVVAVYYGPVHLNVKGFTLRYRPAYNTAATQWVNDPCQLLERELAFGQRRDPAYGTVPSNVTCSTFVAPATDRFPGCPSQTVDWYANNIGGPVGKWTEPSWAEGAWVFKDKGHSVPLKYPGQGKLTVWIGSGPVEVTSANASVLSGKTFDEVSFHCK